MDLYQITLVGISTERKGLRKGGNGSPIPKKQGAGQGNCDQEGCRDDINEECILEFSDDQFDALVDNVEEMVYDVRGEDEMTEAELRKYKQFIEDSKKPLYPPLSEVLEGNRRSEASATKGWSWLDRQEFQNIASSPEGYAARGELATGYCVRGQADCVYYGIEN